MVVHAKIEERIALRRIDEQRGGLLAALVATGILTLGELAPAVLTVRDSTIAGTAADGVPGGGILATSSQFSTTSTWSLPSYSTATRTAG